MDLMKENVNNRIYRTIEMYAETMPSVIKQLQQTGDMSFVYSKITEMYTEICEISGKDNFNNELKNIMQMVSEDIFAEMRRDPYFIGNRYFLNVITWRTGFVAALSPDIHCIRINQKFAELSINLIRFDQKRYQQLDDQLFCLMLNIFDGLDTQDAENILDSIMAQSGACNYITCSSVKTSQVCSFAHPVDSGLVRMLDTPMVNGLFRNFVDLNADLSMGQLLATGIAVNERNYPEINATVDDCVKKLGINRPYVVVSNQLPGINAMTFGSDEEPYMVVSTMLEKAMDEGQLRFVIGHECGHIAMGHVIYHTAASILSIFGRKNFVLGKALSMGLNAWSRRSEITADRAGLLCCGDIDMADKALVQLECAFKNAEDIDIDAYTQGSKAYLDKGFLRKIGEYGADHPLTPKRIEALNEFANSRIYYETLKMEVPETAVSDQVLLEHVEQILKIA